MMSDPTADEMRAYLATLPYASEADAFDIEEAIYWFANDRHGSQSSNLYSALSTSEFSPGPIASGCEPGGMSSMLYDELEAEFA